MTKKVRVKKIRVAFDLPEPEHERLKYLEAQTHLNRANVVRHALQIYEFVILKSLEGVKFNMVDKENVTERLTFFTPYVRGL
jgi:hypothetical protein